MSGRKGKTIRRFDNELQDRLDDSLTRIAKTLKPNVKVRKEGATIFIEESRYRVGPERK